MQAINQKHDGQFDIAIERLWDDDLVDALRGQKWFNPDDFAKGLAIAQARHPEAAPPSPQPPLPVQARLHAAARIAPAASCPPCHAAVDDSHPRRRSRAGMGAMPSDRSAAIPLAMRVRRLDARAGCLLEGDPANAAFAAKTAQQDQLGCGRCCRAGIRGSDRRARSRRRARRHGHSRSRRGNAIAGMRAHRAARARLAASATVRMIAAPACSCRRNRGSGRCRHAGAVHIAIGRGALAEIVHPVGVGAAGAATLEAVNADRGSLRARAILPLGIRRAEGRIRHAVQASLSPCSRCESSGT